MTILPVHPPHIELRREESFSRCEIAAQQQQQQEEEEEQHQQQQQQLEYEIVDVSTPECCYDDTNSISNSNSNSISISISNSKTTTNYLLNEKTVRFSLAPKTIHDYLSRHDITPQEKADSWNTHSDLMAMRDEIQLTRELMDAFVYEGDNLEWTSRGLEGRQRKLVRTCRSVVLQEQYRHGIQGHNERTSQVLIATRYSLCNQSAAAAAHKRGKMDCDEVIDMYLPERLEKEAAQGFGYYSTTMNDDSDSASSEQSCDCE